MKKIDTTQVAPNKRQPFYARSNRHLQEAIYEGDNSIIQGYIQDTALATILWGLTNSTPSTATYTLTAGAIYWAGEIYLVDAQTVTVTGSNKLVGTITTTYQSGEPSQFSDGSLINVNEIRKIVFSDAASGAGTFDFGDVSGNYEDAILIINNLKDVPVIQTATSNGNTITASNVSGTFAYNTDVYAYSYYILHNICHLSFKITFTVTGAGATIDKLRIPLPTGITKATTGAETYSQRGTWSWKAPLATTDYAMGLVYANDDGTEGQRLVLYRGEADKDIVASAVATEVYGQISFPLA